MTMILKCIELPGSEPLTLTDVERQCRIGSLSEEETTVELFISAVRQRAETVTRRALITQKWEMTIDAFPVAGGAIKIPLPPLQTLDSVQYIDGAGVTQTMDPAAYRLVTDDPAYIIPVYGTSWPATQNTPAAVTITFTAGYGDAPENVPASIRQWMSLNVATLYENREIEGVMLKGTTFDFKSLADGLLADYRIYGW